MPNLDAHCHLYVILSRRKSNAVIFRKGPNKWVRMISWDTANDTFEPGQWFHGHIYARRCDLSPDGTKLIYFAQKINSRTLKDTEFTYTWTAISKPPYFTALTLWPKGDCWHGGGLFEEKGVVWLNHRPEVAIPHKGHKPPVRLKVIPNPTAYGEDAPVWYRRLERDGWKYLQEENLQSEIWQKYDQQNQYTLHMELVGYESGRSGGGFVFNFWVVKRGDILRIPIDADQWADWDQQGRLVYVKNGCLYAGKIADTTIETQLLADFSAQKPEPVPPPEWAKTWNAKKPSP